MSLEKRKQSFANWQKRSRKGILGLNLPEVTVTLGVAGVLAVLAAPAFTLGTNPLADSMNLVEGNFKLARSKAMSQTTAYRIRPEGVSQFIMESHASGVGSSVYSCDDAELMTDDGADIWSQAYGFNQAEDMVLQEGVDIKSVTVDGTELSDLTDWELCFDARGMANKNIVLVLEDTESGKTKSLEVFSGGSLVSYDSARYVSSAVSSESVDDSGDAVDVSSGDSDAADADTDTDAGTDISAGSGDIIASGTSKLHCNKGGGNGSEGCDPGNNPDLGNDDENLTDDQQDDVDLLSDDDDCTTFDYDGVTIQVCQGNGQKAVVSFDAEDGSSYIYAFNNQNQCDKDLTSTACTAIYDARATI